MKKRLLLICIFCAIFVALFGSLGHFLYNFSNGNRIVGYFFPVNESTWEHMKLLFFPSLICYIVLCFCKNIESSCILYGFPKAIFLGTFFIPVLFYTYSGILGFTVMFIDIAIFYLCVLITFVSLYKNCTSSKKQEYSLLWNIGLLIWAILFMYFSYHPPILAIFENPQI